MDQLHGRKVHVAQGGHNIRKSVFDGKFRCGTGRELIIDGFILLIRGHRHLVIVPPVAARLGHGKRLIHEPAPKGLVAVHEFQSAECGQDQILLHLLDLPEGSNRLADDVVAHNGHAVVGAARSVVKVLAAAQIGAPVLEELHILKLYPLPHRFTLLRRIVKGDHALDLLLAGLGVQRMAGAVKLQLAVLHRPTPFR